MIFSFYFLLTISSLKLTFSDILAIRMHASWWQADSSWSSRAMSCQTVSPLVILWNSVCPSKSKLKWVSRMGQTIPCYTCLFFQTASLAGHHLNGTVTENYVVDLHVIQILIGICVYPHLFLCFYCNYNLHWKDGLSRKLCTKLNWDLSHHIIYDYCTLLLPHEAGDLPAGAFSGLFLSFLLRNTCSDIASPQTQRKVTSNYQHPTTNNQLSSESQILVT